MAIIWKKKTRLNGTFDLDDRKQKQSWIAITDSREDGPDELAADAGAPQLRSALTEGHPARVSSLQFTYLGGRKATNGQAARYAWQVDVDYSTKIDGETDPLLRDPEVSWEAEELSEAVDRDIWGYPIVQTAGQPYDPPVEQESGREILKISRNQLTYNVDLARRFRFAINALPWRGYPAYWWVCKPITGKRFKENGVWYWSVNYEFALNDKTWLKRLLSIGRYELIDDYSSSAGAQNAYGQILKPIRDRDGNLVADPVPLTIAGRRAAHPNDAAVTSWLTRVPRDFAELDLDT